MLSHGPCTTLVNVCSFIQSEKKKARIMDLHMIGALQLPLVLAFI